MGTASSSSHAIVPASSDECKQYLRAAIARGNTLTGCESKAWTFTVGGAEGGAVGIDDLIHDYDQSAGSKGKRDLIRKLSEGISKVMGVKAPPAGASSDDMVAHLRRIVPDPRRGRNIVSDRAKQTKLCGDIAKVVNDAYGKVVDTSLGPDGVCSQVNDIVQSLGAGLHKELIVVSASVERAIKNITDLKDMMRRSFDKLHSEIAASDDEKLRYKMEGMRNINLAIEQELGRQLALLSNLTNTSLKTADRDLVRLLEENTEFIGLVDSIKRHIGSTEWASKLGYWLSGVNNVAQMALIVDKALKAIGMKAADYKKSTKMAELTMKTHELLVAGANTKFATRDSMNQFVAAVEQLRKYHGFHDEISREIKGAAEAAYSGADAAYTDMYRGGDATLSGEAGGVFGGKVPLRTKLKRHETARGHMLRDFRAKAKVLMDRVYAAIFAAAQKMGRGGIDLTDDIYLFKTALNDLSSVFREGIEYALTGYHTHVNAVEHKDRFLQLLRSMIQILDGLKGVTEFREVSNNVSELIKLVDFYTDRFKVHTGNVTPARASGACDYGGRRGGADSDDDFGVTADGAGDYVVGACDYVGSGDMVVGAGDDVVGAGEFKAVVTLNNARNTFNHFYNIAKFKQNLKQVAAEMKGYNKNYVEGMGAAVAAEIDGVHAWHSSMLGQGGAGPYPEYKADFGALGGEMAGEYGAKKDEYGMENVKGVVDAIADAKIKLYKVAQAIDIYLQNFTDAVATAPEDVRQVAKLLDSVEIMANWFNEKSGDSIAAMYEIFPWTMQGYRTYFNKSLESSMLSLGTTTVRMTAAHYYEAIGSAVCKTPPAEHLHAEFADETKAALPGNPFLPISPGRAVLAHKFAKYTVEKMFALKNIVSAFAYLGDKFAGKSVSQSTFMSPNDMYKNLVEYVYVSALSIGWGKSEQLVIYGRKNRGAGAYDPSELHYEARKVIAGRHLASNIGTGVAAADTDATERAIVVGAAPHTGHVADPSLWLPGNHIAGAFNNQTGGWGFLLEHHGLFKNSPASTSGIVTSASTQTDYEDGKEWIHGGAGWSIANTAGRTHEWSAIYSRADSNKVKRGEFKDSDVDNGVRSAQYQPLVGMRQNLGVVMSGIRWDDTKEEDVDSISGWKACFAKEDRIFITIIKAMAAKVFTVTGLYNMLNFADTRNYALSPMRMILGGGRGRRSGGSGGSFELPKIYPEAVELYARLPLLVEFYRDIFCFEEKCDDPGAAAGPAVDEILISMVPEVGSVYAALIQVIFDQPINAQGLYTDSVQRQVVHEINEIYHVFKSKNPKNYTMAAITDFIAEINSRYGLMARSEITTYRNEESGRRTLDESRYGEGDDIESYDILDEDKQSTAAAPSDRFGKTGATWSPGRLSDEHKIEQSAYAALNKLRKRIDNRFSDVMLTASDGSGMPVASKNVPDFGSLIMSVRGSLQTTDKPEERFKMVANMMVGMDTKTQTKREAYLMFHEYIVAPLNILAAVHDMLARYEREVREWDAYALFKGLEKTFDPWANGQDGPAGHGWKRWHRSRNTDTDDGESWTTAMAKAGGGVIIPLTDANNGATYWTNAANSDMRATMRQHMGIEDGVLEQKIIANLHRLLAHTYNSHGLQGRTFLQLLSTIDLITPRNTVGAAPYVVSVLGRAGAALSADIKQHIAPPPGTTDRDYGPHRILAYAAIRWEALFKKLTNLVYGLTSGLNGLVETNFANGLITINHTKLQSMCEEVLGAVRRDMDKFRGIIDSKTLEKYDSRGTCGSVNWLQEKMIDGLFGDRGKRGIKRAHIIVTKSFQLLANQDPDKRNQRIIYKNYTCGAGVLAINFQPPSWIVAAADPNPVRKEGWSIEDTFAELTHYNSRTMNVAGLSGSEPLDAAPPHLPDGRAESQLNFAATGNMSPMWTADDHMAHLFKDQNPDGKGTRGYTEIEFKARFDFYLQNSATSIRKDKGFRGDYCGGDINSRVAFTDADAPHAHGRSDTGAGLMMKFNEVLAAYLRQFWDIGSGKIYAPLIDKPANGVMNQSVFKALGWPDLTEPILSVATNEKLAEVWEHMRDTEPVNAADRLRMSEVGGVPVGAGEWDAGSVGPPNRLVFIYWSTRLSVDRKSPAPRVTAPFNRDIPAAPPGPGTNRGTLFMAVSKMWSMLYCGSHERFDAGAAPALQSMTIWQNVFMADGISARPARYMRQAHAFNLHIKEGTPYGVPTGPRPAGAICWFRHIADPRVRTTYDLAPPPVWGAVEGTLPLYIPYIAAGDAGDSGINAGGAANHPAMGTATWTVAEQGNRAPANANPCGGGWHYVGHYNAGFGMDAKYGSDDTKRALGAGVAVGDRMPGTFLSNAAMFCVSMRSMHKLKRFIIHSARKIRNTAIDTMRDDVYSYIENTLSREIYQDEIIRCTAAVQLQHGPQELFHGFNDQDAKAINDAAAAPAAWIAAIPAAAAYLALGTPDPYPLFRAQMAAGGQPLATTNAIDVVVVNYATAGVAPGTVIHRNRMLDVAAITAAITAGLALGAGITAAIADAPASAEIRANVAAHGLLAQAIADAYRGALSVTYSEDLTQGRLDSGPYVLAIEQQAKRVQAFVTDYMLKNYAGAIFRTIAAEQRMTIVPPVTHVTIVDVVALATVLLEPVSRELSIMYHVWASELGRAFHNKPMTRAGAGDVLQENAVAIANQLARVRAYYESGGYLPLAQGAAMFDAIRGNYAAHDGARLGVAIAAIQNAVTFGGYNDARGGIDMIDTIFGNNAATVIGTGDGANHAQYYPGLAPPAVGAHNSLNPDTMLRGVVVSKMLGLGVSYQFIEQMDDIAIPAGPANVAAASVLMIAGSSEVNPNGGDLKLKSTVDAFIALNHDFARNNNRATYWSNVDVVDLKQLCGRIAVAATVHATHRRSGSCDGKDGKQFLILSAGGQMRQNLIVEAKNICTALGLMHNHLSTEMGAFYLGDKSKMLSSNLPLDMFELSPNPGTFGDPEEIIFASLGKIMRTALTETGRGGTKPNLVQSMAEVPSRMKEQYKSQLPIFHDMFSLIGKKAELLKGVSRLGIGLDRPTADVAAGIRSMVKNVNGPVHGHRVLTQKDSEVFYTKILDKITASCDSMKKTCDEVLNELNDAPLYLETAENSIQAFKSANGGLPFMPLSTALVTLSPPVRSGAGAPVPIDGGAVQRRDCELGYPTDGPGSDVDTFNYATRLLLHRYDTNIMLEHMPGVQDILAKYNRACIPAKRIEEKTYGLFINKVANLLRYAAGTKIYSTLFGAERHVVDRNLFIDDRAIKRPVFQATIPLSDALSLTSSSDQESSLVRTVGFVAETASSAGAPRSRRDALTYNILDLNVSPINVHAMRREIPLVNIYNYAYTFDTFVTEFTHSNADKCAALTASATTHELLAALCKDPHGVIKKEVYYKRLRALVSGASTIDAYGYPKFIADQLWNKALLNQIDAGDDDGKMYRDRRGTAGPDLAGLDAWINGGDVDLRYRKSDLRDGVHGSAGASVKPTGVTLGLNIADVIQGQGQSQKQYLGELGRLRFDTTFARNMFFIANVQRLMLSSIKKELSRAPYPIATDTSVADRGVTDYNDHEVHADLSID